MYNSRVPLIAMEGYFSRCLLVVLILLVAGTANGCSGCGGSKGGSGSNAFDGGGGDRADSSEGGSDDATPVLSPLDVTVAIPLLPEQAAMLNGIRVAEGKVSVDDQSVAERARGDILAGVKGGVYPGKRSLIGEPEPVPGAPDRSRGEGVRGFERRAEGAGLAFVTELTLPRELSEGVHVFIVVLFLPGRPDVPLVRAGASVAVKEGRVQESPIDPIDVSMPSNNGAGLPNLVQAFAQEKAPELGLDPTRESSPLTDDEIARIVGALKPELEAAAQALTDEIRTKQNVEIPLPMDSNLLAVPTIVNFQCAAVGAETCGTISSTSVVFNFGCDRASGCAFECSVDKAAFAACDAPYVWDGFAEGTRVFAVRAKTASGVTGSAASLIFLVQLPSGETGGEVVVTPADDVPPDTTLVGAGLPALVTDQTSATFKFTCSDTSDEQRATGNEACSFQCSLDSAPFSSCSSPYLVGAGFTPALSEGSHTFAVRAVDPAGNIDSSPAGYAWTIDLTAPDTKIDSGPASLTNSTGAIFTFSEAVASGKTAETGTTFECDLDGGGYSVCTSPHSINGPLAPGSHTFSVRIRDAVGNADGSPAGHVWTIDVTAPSAALSSQPSAISNSSSATFSFSSADTTATFECELDGGGFAACASPKSYLSLAAGSRTFKVRARDPAGNIGSPATHTWTIDVTAPSAPAAGNLTVTQNAPGVNDQLSGSAGAVEGGATVKVYKEAGLTTLLGSGTAAGDGSFTAFDIGDNQATSDLIYVVAVDAAGNVSGSTSKTNDVTGPTFGGLTSATTVSDSQIDLGWSAATDNVTAQGSIVYDICRTTTSGGCSTFSATYTTTAGATSYNDTTGLSGGTRYYYVVRGKDEAGHTDTNTTEKSAVTWSTGIAQAVTTGKSHTCSLLADGKVRCWGLNDYGQLGDGTTSNRPTPVMVSSLSGVTAVAAYFGLSNGHTCSVLMDGTIRCWGNNCCGQLGDGTTVQKITPVAVSTLTGAVAVTAGEWHTCSVNSDGSVKCWGGNLYGQLGDGTSGSGNSRSTPVAVSTLTGAVGVAAGTHHSCAVLSDGSARCWGRGLYGRLGDGTTNDRSVPTAVTSLTSAITIAGGWYHTCALLASGTVKCWGIGGSGALGDGTTNDRYSPVAVTSLTGAIAIAVGGNVTCAVVSDGVVRCWGTNDDGQLGDGTTVNSSLPVPVSSLSSIQSIVVGGWHACALSSGGSVRCWGRGNSGQLGDGMNTQSITPVSVSMSAGPLGVKLPRLHESSGGRGGPARPFREGLTAHLFNHTCVLLSNGAVKCWGKNDSGQLGDGTTANKTTPVAVSSLTGVVAITGGSSHTCSLLSDGTVKCWGANASGQLGDGMWVNKTTPVAVTSLSGAVAVSAGGFHTCSLLSDGTVRCWGFNTYGQLGFAPAGADRSTPVAVTSLSGAVAVSGGDNHTCSLLSDGTVKCWGRNSFGQLGDGTTANNTVPVAVSSLSSAVAVAGSSNHTCSLLSDGTVKCWGSNSLGQLGDGTTVDKSAPVAVSALSAAVAVSGGLHTCSLLSDGTVKCWGYNFYGQLGDGTVANKSAPVAVSALSAAVAVSGGETHTCSLLSDGTVKCWGRGDSGQLGDGTTVNRLTPVQVQNLP